LPDSNGPNEEDQIAHQKFIIAMAEHTWQQDFQHIVDDDVFFIKRTFVGFGCRPIGYWRLTGYW
jgi:hypothetical protein